MKYAHQEKSTNTSILIKTKFFISNFVLSQKFKGNKVVPCLYGEIESRQWKFKVLITKNQQLISTIGNRHFPLSSYKFGGRKREHSIDCIHSKFSKGIVGVTMPISPFSYCEEIWTTTLHIPLHFRIVRAWTVCIDDIGGKMRYWHGYPYNAFANFWVYQINGMLYFRTPNL